MKQHSIDFGSDSTADIYERVVSTIARHLGPESNFDVCAVAWSGGKDSSVLLALALEAARRTVQMHGAMRPMAVMNSNTRIENPLVEQLVTHEQTKITAFAQEHGLDVHLVTGRPTVASSWAVKIIAGNALPPMPGGKGWCTIDWKIEPLRKAISRWQEQMGARDGRVLKLTGTRFSESNERGRKMALRGESATEPAAGRDGDWILSPIADLDTDDIWELIGSMRDGSLPNAYTDFDELLGVYSSAGGASCPMLADYRMGGDLGSCEARTGCWACTKVERDESLKSMLDDHPYLKGLYRIREWLAAIMWDFNHRAWVGRTIDEDGYIKVQPDGFSSETTTQLLRYVLTVDAEEDEWAERNGRERRFERVIDLESLILIDFGWSLNGIQPRPFEAWRIHREIANEGKRFYPPQIDKTPREAVPQTRYLHVGSGWESYRTWWACGLRDVLAEALEADTPGEYPMRVLPDGREIFDIERSQATSVDTNSEHLWDYLQFLLDDDMARAQRGELGNPEAVRIYLQFGVVQHPDHGQIDAMLRRTAYRQHMGIGRDQLPGAVMARTISEEERGRDTMEAAATTQMELALCA